MLTLGVDNIVAALAARSTTKLARVITIIGIPSAFLLHGYVGFIFGSVKANPWWSTPLMPIVFLFSAMVSGIAAGDAHVHGGRRGGGARAIDMRCLDTIARYLFYAFIIDFSLEMLDLVHRIYEADESFKSLDFMVHTRLFTSQIVIQIVLGHAPAPGPAVPHAGGPAVRARRAEAIYATAGVLTMVGIFAMRWNVVIGGQLFSKSFLGYTTYKLDFATREGLLPAIVLMILPFVILAVLVRLLPPWEGTAGPDEVRS